MTKQKKNFSFEDLNEHISQERRAELKEKAEFVGRNYLAWNIVSKIYHAKLAPEIPYKETFTSEEEIKEYIEYREKIEKYAKWMMHASEVKGEVVEQDGEYKLIRIPKEVYQEGQALFFTEEEKQILNSNISDEEIEAYEQDEEEIKAADEHFLYEVNMLNIPEPKTVYEELYYTKTKYEAGIKELTEDMEKLAKFHEVFLKSRGVNKIALDLGYHPNIIEFDLSPVAKEVFSKFDSFKAGKKPFKEKDLVAEQVLIEIRKRMTVDSYEDEKEHILKLIERERVQKNAPAYIKDLVKRITKITGKEKPPTRPTLKSWIDDYYKMDKENIKKEAEQLIKEMK